MHEKLGQRIELMVDDRLWNRWTTIRKKSNQGRVWPPFQLAMDEVKDNVPVEESACHCGPSVKL